MVISVSVTPGTAAAAGAEVTPSKQDTSAAPIKRISMSQPPVAEGVNLLHEPELDGSSTLQQPGSPCCTAKRRAQNPRPRPERGPCARGPSAAARIQCSSLRWPASA